MIEDLVGDNGTRFIIAAGAVALGLVCLVFVLRFIRNRPSSPFIRGGKNRQPRLAVLDAAAIDTRRRLVLVRRDDVEHLIMIGGPTDVVIESRIAAGPVSVPLPAEVPQTPPIVAQQAASARQPLPERRGVPQPEMKSPPVSAMGQVLYGENTPMQTARPAQPPRPQAETSAVARQAVPARPTPAIQPPVTAQPNPVVAGKSPEEIFDAARNRVLAANQAAPASQQPTTSAPVSRTPPAAQQTPAGDFERLLDAEISGDLGRLTAGTAGTPAVQRPDAVIGGTERPAARPAGPARTEPSLEDEMNRMLGEIAVNRKS